MKTKPNLQELTAIAEQEMFLTVSDITKLLKVSRPVVDRLIRSGQIPAAKFGGKQYRIKTADFIKWWDRQVKQEQHDLLRTYLPKDS